MCTYSYCDGTCNAPDDYTISRCDRQVGPQRCRVVLNEDGTCPCCETVACSICGGIMDPGTSVDMPDPESGRPLRLCGVCVVEVRADAAELEAEGRRLLAGRDPAEDGLDLEDEAVEIGVESMAELVHGPSLKGAA